MINWNKISRQILALALVAAVGIVTMPVVQGEGFPELNSTALTGDSAPAENSAPTGDSAPAIVKPLEFEPVSYYSFDNDSGNTVTDLWGAGRTATNQGTIGAGKVGQALQVTSEFNGVTITGPNPIGANDPWTMAFWVKADTDFNRQIAPVNTLDKNFAIALKMDANRPSGFRVGPNSGDVLTFKYNFERDQWYHVAFTQSKTNGLTMYVNGEKTDRTNAWTKNHRVMIPADLLGGTGFIGSIDEVKIFKKELNADQVKQLSLLKGLNITSTNLQLSLNETKQIELNLVSDYADKTVTYTSSEPAIVDVDANGLLTAKAYGSAEIHVKNAAAGYEEVVTVNVIKKVNIKNILPEYQLPVQYVSDVEKSPGTDRQYLGQPDMIKTKTGRLILAYPMGHGKGPLIMRISDDNARTWVEKITKPASWTGSQETPTMYPLNFKDGSQKLILITACPGWGQDNDGNQYGFNTSISADDGETWSEYQHFYSQRADGTNNESIVAMASLIQLRDENGELMDKWLGVYHDYQFHNYKTFLTFDADGNQQWSVPEPYLSQYRDIEARNQICEVGMFRSKSNGRIYALARSQSHNNPATIFYSDDEGRTFSRPVDLPGSLAGERHKIVYDPISDRLVIPFREIRYDLDNNGVMNNDWRAGNWIAWVGTFEDLINQNDGQYRILIAEDFTQNRFGGDTGYTGINVLDDGTFVLASYGHFDEQFSKAYVSPATGRYDARSDLAYIKQARFSLGVIDNGKILIKSVKDDAGNPVAGAIFALQHGDTVVKTAVSDSQGIVEFSQVGFGNYTIVQKATLDSLSVSKDVLAAEIKAMNETVVLGDVINLSVTNVDPGTPTPEPGTPTPEPGTPTPEPGTPTPDPGTATPDPGTATPDPGTATPDPGTATPDPGTATPDPGTATPEPGTPTPDPGTATPEPGTATPEPGTPTPEPGTATPDPGTAVVNDGKVRPNGNGQSFDFGQAVRLDTTTQPNLPTNDQNKDKVPNTGATRSPYFWYGILSLTIAGFLLMLFYKRIKPIINI